MTNKTLKHYKSQNDTHGTERHSLRLYSGI